MARCEDYPCCNHERGCCPTFVNGVQTDMVCTCGKRLPINNRSSICDSCLNADRFDDDYGNEMLNEYLDRQEDERWHPSHFEDFEEEEVGYRQPYPLDTHFEDDFAECDDMFGDY